MTYECGFYAVNQKHLITGNNGQKCAVCGKEV